MKLNLYTKDDLFVLAKAIITNATGVDYPFSPKTLHRAFAQVAAFFGADASAQTLNLVKGTALEGTSGILLERKGLESGVVKLDAAPARGRGKFIPLVSPASTDYTIPQDSVVIRSATSTQSEIAFQLEATATIPSGATESNLVSVVAQNEGEVANDIVSGTSLSLKYAINGVSHFLLTTDTGGGRDKQQDSEYRASIRNAKRSYGEGSWAGIESLLKTVQLDTGARIIAARVFEDFLNDAVLAYIDDGSGDSSLVGPIDDTTYAYGGATWWEYPSSGSEIYVQLPYYHLPYWNDGSDARLQWWDGSSWNAQTLGTDYYIDINTGVIAMVTPLNLGEKVRAQFEFYTGLVGEAAKWVNGVRGSQTIKGWRSAGLPIQIRGPASVVKPSVSGSIVFDENFDSQFGRELAETLVLTYLNSLDINEPARYPVITKIILGVPGSAYLTDLLLGGGTSDVPPSSTYGVVRGDATTITF